MPVLPLYNQTGQKVGDITLADSIFGVQPHPDLVHRAVLVYRAGVRQGTHDVKNRGEVRGGGRKPWRQKGTGRARQGSIRSPQWVGGGVVFGPTPRSYTLTMPKKMRRLALKSALSSKVSEGQTTVVDALTLTEIKTKAFVNILKALSVTGKALVVVPEVTLTLERSARNLPGVKVIPVERINVYDLLLHDHLILTEAAVRRIEEVYA